ncbi:MAG: DUF4115 domain-containing protein, partial [Desulfitobacterium sp.]|nr:DUF4115 domain-containing protein [Desulfitobacterium sp.]
EALEEEDYEILPGATYTKGFLRTYAKHLGIDPEEVLALYRTSNDEVEPEVYRPVSNIPRKGAKWLKPALIGLAGAIALGVVIGIASWSKPEGNNISPEDITPPLPTAPQEEIVQQENEELPASESVEKEEPPATTDPYNDEVVVQLAFTENCWIRVNVDGQPTLEGTFSPGVTKELRGKEQVELVRVGNAGGVNVTVNGEVMRPLGASGAVVNNIVYSKDMGEGNNPNS